MEFSQLLLEFLKKNGNAYVPSFGEFYLKKTNAFVDKDTQNILPPGKEVAFNNEVNGNGNAFIQFLSSQKNISALEAEIEIKKQVNFWNSKLEKDGQFILEHFGTFFLDESKILFTGIRTENLSPDFYGLEEINISEIKNKKPFSDSGSDKKSYALSKSIYWIVPLVIVLSAIAYLAITQPEQIFGRQSFPDELMEKAVIKTKKEPAIKDSTIVNPSVDSLKTDSLKSASIINKTPVKKWSSKKYSKSKWKKAKKRQNR